MAQYLSERGNGFDITAALGTATLESAHSDPADALREADRRMYAEKNGRRASAGGQSTAVLLRVIAERSPDLGEHVDGVATLAEQVAVELGMNGEDRTAVWQAAMLHDIGKAAVPDAILTKPGSLDESEWAFIRRHTMIGSGSFRARPRSRRRHRSSAHRTSASTGPATRTAWPEAPSRSAPASSLSATPTTPWSRAARISTHCHAPGPARSCSAVPAPNSIRMSCTPFWRRSSCPSTRTQRAPASAPRPELRAGSLVRLT
jgi:putative nucleotidyltransferase with HDIG domain